MDDERLFRAPMGFERRLRGHVKLESSISTFPRAGISVSEARLNVR